MRKKVIIKRNPESLGIQHSIGVVRGGPPVDISLINEIRNDPEKFGRFQEAIKRELSKPQYNKER